MTAPWRSIRTPPPRISNRGSALALLDRLEEGLESLERAIALQPDLVQAYTNRGNFLTDLKRYDEALASFDRAIAVNPQSAEAHFGKSQVLLVRGQFEEAWPPYEWRKRRVAEDAFHAARPARLDGTRRYRGQDRVHRGRAGPGRYDPILPLCARWWRTWAPM